MARRRACRVATTGNDTSSARRDEGAQLRQQVLILTRPAGILEMPGVADVRALVSGDGVFGRELPGRGYRRVEAGGGHMPGLADLPGGDGGILVRQGCGHVTVGAGEALHRGRDPYPP